MEWLLGLLLTLLVLGGAVAGIVAIGQIRTLREELRRTDTRLARLSADVTQLSLGGTVQTPSDREPQRLPTPSQPVDAPSPETPAEETPAAALRNIREATDDTLKPVRETVEPHPLMVSLQENWMIWLGGACVALAGIFLVRYSIEQGLLGPTARFVAGLVTGITLHAAAEYLRRRTGEKHAAFAAMAGAGSITLFATLLAGMRLYDLIAPGTAFILMAIVALGTMAMAYIHGPFLAAFGILGAYVVPILTSTGSGQVVIAMVYALIISASALLLLRYVYRPWLWWGFLIGAFGWWLITLTDGNGDGFRSIYLAMLAYLILAVPNLDWLLKHSVKMPLPSYRLSGLGNLEDATERNLPYVFIAFVVAYAATITWQQAYIGAWIVALPLYALSFPIARRREQLYWLPWALLLTQCLAWLAPRYSLGETGWFLDLLNADEAGSFGIYLMLCALLSSFFSGINWNHCRFKAAWASLATLAPFLLLALGYVLSSRLIESWHWGMATVLLALATMIGATRVQRSRSIEALVVWLFVAGHFGLSLAAAMMFNEASLTLAIALQMVSLAWIIRSFSLPALDWLLKIVVSIVIVRLTLNPWLASYPDEINWPLFSYGGATISAVAAMYLLKGYPTIARWCEGAALHLFVLTIFAELRYQFHDGAVFASSYTFAEACTYLALFAALGLVYYKRSLVSTSLQKLYLLFSKLLAALALFNYMIIVAQVLVSDRWIVAQIDTTPIFNATLAAFALPALFGVLYWRLYLPTFKRKALGFAGFAGFIYISLQVRHLWTGTIHLDRPAVSDGELYTYSAVWLMIAIFTILLGSWRLGQDCYRAGMALLALVIGKLFFIDMSDLEGLLRVASFMGLGLSLLGVSYIHQKLTRKPDTVT